MDSRTAAFDRKRPYDELDDRDSERSAKKVNNGAAEATSGLAPTINWNSGAKSKIRTTLTLGGNRPRLVDSKSTTIPHVPAQQDATTSPVVISDDENSDSQNDVVLNLEGQSVNESKQAEPPGTVVMEVKDTSTVGNPRVDEYNPSESQEDGEVGSGDAIDATMDNDSGMEPEAQQKDAMDYSTSGAEVPATLHKQSERSMLEQSLPKTLADLDVAELKKQLKYFYVGKDPTYIDLNEPVNCLVCAKQGHTILTCPALVCQSCQMVKDHFTRDCPKTRKCQKCRNRGHDRQNCSYKLPNLDVSELHCELCQRSGHAEAECELIWRTSGQPWEFDLRFKGATLSCYECGGGGHLGNTCPTRNPRKPLGSSTWGQVNRQHIQSALKPSNGGMAIKGRAQQRNLRGRDSDEDGNNFIRPRIPPPSRQGQIHVVSRSNISNPPARSSPNVGRGSGGDHWGAPMQQGSSRNGTGDPRRFVPEPVSLDRGYQIRSRSEVYDSYQPPLHSQQSSPRRNGGKGAPGSIYRPMPLAAERAWKKHRS